MFENLKTKFYLWKGHRDFVKFDKSIHKVIRKLSNNKYDMYIAKGAMSGEYKDYDYKFTYEKKQ